ncbi:MAG: hypothetical protein PHV39_02900 [Methanomicrobium sp.]|nr:hypothetical protein [Methanomicrobium sp.]
MIPVASESIKLTASVEVRIKHPFSYDHLRSAIFFAKNARELEKKYENNFDSLPPEEQTKIREEYFALTTNAIISSFAFAEAHINEFYDNVIQYKSNQSPSKTIMDKLYDKNSGDFTNIQSLLSQKITGKYKPSSLNKYKFALDSFNEDPFETGKNPYLDFDLVREVRNSFVHYNPELQPAQIEGMENEKATFEGQLQGKFDLNPFFKNTGNPFYPYKCLSYGSAKWAITSCYEFVKDFYSKFDLESRYGDIIKRLDE